MARAGDWALKGRSSLLAACTAGVPWDSVLCRETLGSRSGKVLEALCPRHEGVSFETANGLLESVTDLEVEVHFNDGARQRPLKSVKWADLEDIDAEDKECAGIAVGCRA